MKFVCLGYIDERKAAEVLQDEGRKMFEACMAYDDELRRGGHFIRGEALDAASKAVTLRTNGGKVEATDGPYAETKEMLGGILFLEARDMEHAVALMSKHPGVKMGPFEIRPAHELVNQLIAERDAAVKKQS
ncbi:MAG: dehydrogenase [Pirellula sp.]|nr:dehydrogenase [Pirellula sp.]